MNDLRQKRKNNKLPVVYLPGAVVKSSLYDKITSHTFFTVYTILNIFLLNSRYLYYLFSVFFYNLEKSGELDTPGHLQQPSLRTGRGMSATLQRCSNPWIHIHFAP